MKIMTKIYIFYNISCQVKICNCLYIALYCKFGFSFSHHLSSRWIKKTNKNSEVRDCSVKLLLFFFQSAHLILFQKLQIVNATVEESTFFCDHQNNFGD